jgi:hypothetical protein
MIENLTLSLDIYSDGTVLTTTANGLPVFSPDDFNEVLSELLLKYAKELEEVQN